MENFQERFEAFKPVLLAAVNKSYEGFNKRITVQGRKPIELSYQEGPKFIRIVKKIGESGGGSAFGFIDKSNGNLLKAAGWKAPAKNFARGNIFAEDFGVGRVQWTGIQ